MNPPFRAEHIGSLLRPPELRRAFREHQEGRLGADEFRRVQDAAIRDVVAFQERIGLHGVTDGEFRRASYWSHVVDSVEGFEVAPARFDFHDDCGHEMHFLAPLPVGKLRRAKPISGDELDFLKATTRATPKITLPAPSTFHFWQDPASFAKAGYRDDDAYLDDVTRFYREEIADLARRGLTYLQLDEVALAMLCDDGIRARVEEPDRHVGRYVELINACLAERPKTMTVGIHLCRGNFKGQWLAEGSYRPVAERLFNDVAVDAFFLEYDTARAGGFAPLAAVPSSKSVVLGLVSTKTPVLEDAADLRARVEEASRYLPLERLAVSPQCGFASAVSGNPVTSLDQDKKLRRVVETARNVWG
jgi:5-methyltetrahydropteroyltriglutamate--homocysteine methyltransferase